MKKKETNKKETLNVVLSIFGGLGSIIAIMAFFTSGLSKDIARVEGNISIMKVDMERKFERADARSDHLFEISNQLMKEIKDTKKE